MLFLNSPICLVGDIHGQLRDLIHILAHVGLPPGSRFLFLGDYVDRGESGIEVMLLVLALKVKYPQSVFLLRGNHECRRTTNIYGFRHECATKYDQEVFEAFTEVFNLLPLAALVDGQYFAVHGGISPHLDSPLDLAASPKFDCEIPPSGLFCDLVWADPCELPLSSFADNNRRKCSVLFGKAASENFLAKNKLATIIRAHQCVEKGFEAIRWSKEFPQVITIFSAENYCDKGNAGAFLSLAVSLKERRPEGHPVRLQNQGTAAPRRLQAGRL